MTTLETLKAARKLISNKKRWTQGTAARDPNGEPCLPTSTVACCWCAEGAIERVLDGDDERTMIVIHALDAVAGGRMANSINDDGTHAEVMAMYDAAIAAAEAKQ